jgi:excisionase family DNA binding protein
MSVRDYARKFSLDESTVYKMIERGEIKAIRIGKKTLRIPSSELERDLDREPTVDLEAASLEEKVEIFRKANGKDPDSYVDAWRRGKSRTRPRTPRSRSRRSPCARRWLVGTLPLLKRG